MSKVMTKASSGFVDAHIGARVRQRRLELNLSQQALGDVLGVSFQQIQKYENGSNRIAGSFLLPLSQVLQCSPAYFFAGLADGAAGRADPPEPVDRQAAHLLRDFDRIPSQGQRQAVLALVSQLARDGRS